MPRKKDDTDFLKEYVGQAENNAPTVSGTTKKDESATEFLEDLTADTPVSKQPSTARQERLQKKAEQADAADAERQKRKQLREEQARADEIERERVEQARTLNDRIQRGISRTSSAISPTVDKVGALPTVGGIGLLLVILAILLFLVVIVNDAGDTRAKQFWYMLTGRASLQGAVKPTAATSIAPASTPATSGGPSAGLATVTQDMSSNGRMSPSDLLGF